MELRDKDELIAHLQGKVNQFKILEDSAENEKEKMYYQGYKKGFVAAQIYIEMFPNVDLAPVFKDLLYFIEDERKGASNEIIKYIKDKYDIDLMHF